VPPATTRRLFIKRTMPKAIQPQPKLATNDFAQPRPKFRTQAGGELALEEDNRAKCCSAVTQQKGGGYIFGLIVKLYLLPC